MQFFLYEIVARIVAIYLGVDCFRKIRRALAEGKIVFFNPDLVDWSRWSADRSVSPVRYWIQIGIQTMLLVACIAIAIFGWLRPGA